MKFDLISFVMSDSSVDSELAKLVTDNSLFLCLERSRLEENELHLLTIPIGPGCPFRPSRPFSP